MPEVYNPNRQETPKASELKSEEFKNFEKLRRQQGVNIEFGKDDLELEMKEAELFQIYKKAGESAVDFVKGLPKGEFSELGAKIDQLTPQGVEATVLQLAVEGKREQLTKIVADLEAYKKSAEQVLAEEAELKSALGAQASIPTGGEARAEAGVDRVLSVKDAKKAEVRQRWLDQDAPGGARWDGLYRLTDAEWEIKKAKLAVKDAKKAERQRPAQGAGLDVLVQRGEEEAVSVSGETMRAFTESRRKLEQLKAELVEALLVKKEISNETTQNTFKDLPPLPPLTFVQEGNPEEIEKKFWTQRANVAPFVGDVKGSLANLEAAAFAAGAKKIEEDSKHTKDVQSILESIKDESGIKAAVKSFEKNPKMDKVAIGKLKEALGKAKDFAESKKILAKFLAPKEKQKPDIKQPNVLTDEENGRIVSVEKTQTSELEEERKKILDLIRKRPDTKDMATEQVDYQLEIIDDKEAEEILGKAEVHGDEFLGGKLTAEILKEEGLQPKHKIHLGDSVVWFSSSAYDLDRGRIAVAAYVENKGKISVRSYYRSNSQGVWRYLPDYTLDSNGNVNWFGKGHGEESVTLPVAMQKALAVVTGEGMPILETKRNSEFIFAGTAKKYGTNKDQYYQEIESVPKKLQGDFYPASGKTPPEQMTLTDEETPDLSKSISSWNQKSDLYGGNISIEVFPSKDGKLKFMFCKDQAGRAWIGGIEDESETQSTGLKKTWIQCGDLTTPAFEYKSFNTDQTGGYGNDKIRSGKYVDMYEKYLQKIPVIQEYLKPRFAQQERAETLIEKTESDKAVMFAQNAAEAPVVSAPKKELPNKRNEEIQKFFAGLGETPLSESAKKAGEKSWTIYYLAIKKYFEEKGWRLGQLRPLYKKLEAAGENFDEIKKVLAGYIVENKEIDLDELARMSADPAGSATVEEPVGKIEPTPSEEKVKSISPEKINTRKWAIDLVFETAEQKKVTRWEDYFKGVTAAKLNKSDTLKYRKELEETKSDLEKIKDVVKKILSENPNIGLDTFFGAVPELKKWVADRGLVGFVEQRIDEPEQNEAEREDKINDYFDEMEKSASPTWEQYYSAIITHQHDIRRISDSADVEGIKKELETADAYGIKKIVGELLLKSPRIKLAEFFSSVKAGGEGAPTATQIDQVSAPSDAPNTENTQTDADEVIRLGGEPPAVPKRRLKKPQKSKKRPDDE